jgi:hypothetical protein
MLLQSKDDNDLPTRIIANNRLETKNYGGLKKLEFVQAHPYLPIAVEVIKYTVVTIGHYASHSETPHEFCDLRHNALKHNEALRPVSGLGFGLCRASGSQPHPTICRLSSHFPQTSAVGSRESPLSPLTTGSERERT